MPSPCPAVRRRSALKSPQGGRDARKSGPRFKLTLHEGSLRAPAASAAPADHFRRLDQQPFVATLLLRRFHRTHLLGDPSRSTPAPPGARQALAAATRVGSPYMLVAGQRIDRGQCGALRCPLPRRTPQNDSGGAGVSVSAEPLLEPLGESTSRASNGSSPMANPIRRYGPMDITSGPDTCADQCPLAADVKFFFKRWGDQTPKAGRTRARQEQHRDDRCSTPRRIRTWTSDRQPG